MLIQDFMQVEASYARVRSLLLPGTAEWMTQDADAAYADGERLFLSVASIRPDIAFGPRSKVELGEPRPRGDGVVLPLTWRASGSQWLFPILDADLEAMPLGPGQVMLTIAGRYEPPLGSVGRRLDRLVLHRIAESAVRGFLRRTASTIEGRDAPHAPAPAPISASVGGDDAA